MPKVSRSGGRSPKTRKTRKSQPRRAPAGPSLVTRVRNMASARLRAAHYRLGAAARLFAFAAAAVLVLSLAILTGLGRLEQAAAWAGRSADQGLREAGFTVRAVDVAGAGRADSREILDALQLDSAHSIFAMDLAGARARVEAVDWVDQASVLRLLPDRIHVAVTEQAPMARWQIDGQIVVIDGAGEAIDRAAPDQYGALPLVVGEGAAPAAPALLAALDQFPELGRRVEAAQRVGERRWTLFLEGGMQLLLPEADGEAALAILSDMHARRGLLDIQAASIDLRNPDQMVVTPAEGGQIKSSGRGPGSKA